MKKMSIFLLIYVIVINGFMSAYVLKELGSGFWFLYLVLCAFSGYWAGSLAAYVFNKEGL